MSNSAIAARKNASTVHWAMRSLRRYALRLLALAVPSLILGYAADAAFDVPHPAFVAFGFAALIVAHAVFFSTLRASLRPQTPRRRLWLNIGWYALYIGVVIAIYAGLYAEVGLKDGAQTDQIATDAPTALFFSVITWTSTGYGDVTAVAPFARFLAAAQALNGYVVMAIFIAILVASFERLLTRDD